MDARYGLHDVDEIASPCLLFFKPLIAENLRVALDAVGGHPSRLRPHVKTHKTREIVRWQLDLGITKHKCATLREASMLSGEGAPDVLIAYAIVGPNLELLADIIERYPSTDLQCLVDDADAARSLDATMRDRGLRIGVFLDLDVGMHRTGVPMGPAADEVCRVVLSLPRLDLKGLHAYDGHNHSAALAERLAVGADVLDGVRSMRDRLAADGSPTLSLVMGGTPSFPCYAHETDVESSPGTFVLFDAGYGGAMPDLGFTPAALLLSRVVSRHVPHQITIDLGHKAISADPAGDRGAVLSLDGAKPGPQHEEHWVIELPEQTRKGPRMGDPVFVCPTHVCPTVALHSQAYVVEDGDVVDTWEIAARDRRAR